MRVEEQRQRRAQRQRDVLELVVGGEQDQPVGWPVAGLGVAIFASAAVEDRAPAAELRGQVDHRDDDHEVDQDVLDERDQRGRPQAGLVGVDGQDRRTR